MCMLVFFRMTLSIILKQSVSYRFIHIVYFCLFSPFFRESMLIKAFMSVKNSKTDGASGSVTNLDGEALSTTNYSKIHII